MCLDLVHKVDARRKLGHHAHQQAEHDPPAVGDLVTLGPTKAAGRMGTRVRADKTHANATHGVSLIAAFAACCLKNLVSSFALARCSSRVATLERARQPLPPRASPAARTASTLWLVCRSPPHARERSSAAVRGLSAGWQPHAAPGSGRTPLPARAWLLCEVATVRPDRVRNSRRDKKTRTCPQHSCKARLKLLQARVCHQPSRSSPCSKTWCKQFHSTGTGEFRSRRENAKKLDHLKVPSVLRGLSLHVHLAAVVSLAQLRLSHATKSCGPPMPPTLVEER